MLSENAGLLIQDKSVGDAAKIVHFFHEQVEEMNITGLVIGYPLELTGFQGKQVGFSAFPAHYGSCAEIFKIHSYLACACGTKSD